MIHPESKDGRFPNKAFSRHRRASVEADLEVTHLYHHGYKLSSWFHDSAYDHGFFWGNDGLVAFYVPYHVERVHLISRGGRGGARGGTGEVICRGHGRVI